MPKGAQLTDEQKAAKVKEKQAKFSELAGKRLPKLLAAIDAMTKLGSYGPNEVQKNFVQQQIQQRLSQLSAAYAGTKVASASVMEIPMEAPEEKK